MANNNRNIIKRLQKKYDEARAKRIAKERSELPYKERLEDIFSAPKWVTTDFYCTVCNRDCSGTGYRQVCTIREKLPTAWFLGYCPLGHRMIRRITDKTTDPYYDYSPMVQRQRYELRDAFLTPDDPRFKILYPKQYEELMKKKDGEKTAS